MCNLTTKPHYVQYVLVKFLHLNTKRTRKTYSNDKTVYNCTLTVAVKYTVSIGFDKKGQVPGLKDQKLELLFYSTGADRFHGIEPVVTNNEFFCR